MKVKSLPGDRVRLTIEKGDDFSILDEKGIYFGMIRYMPWMDIVEIYLPENFKIDCIEKGKTDDKEKQIHSPLK